jgi:DNA-binding LacI/PurR family transcriptional regulator
MGMGKREKITGYLRNEILHGRLKPGDRIYSRFEIMRRFACTRATADRAVSGLIADGVLETVKGGGTFVARPGKLKRVNALSVVAPHFSRPSMAQEVFQGFMQGVGSDQQVRFFTYDELQQSRSWGRCQSHRGIAFIMPDVRHSLYVMEALARGIPHVVAYRDPPESPFVSIDNTGAMAGLVSALAEQGRSRIAFIGRREGRYHFPEQRYAGFLETLLKNSLAFHPGLARLVPESAVEAALPGIIRERPDGLVAVNVPLGKIIEAGERQGWKAGGDFTLCNFDAVAPGTYPFPVIHTESVTGEIGKRTAAMLLRLIEGQENKTQEYVLPGIHKGDAA